MKAKRVEETGKREWHPVYPDKLFALTSAGTVLYFSICIRFQQLWHLCVFVLILYISSAPP